MHTVEVESGTPQPDSSAKERRLNERTTYPLATTVFGIDAGGAPFKCMTVVDNLSASGLYLRLRQKMAEGASLSLVVHIAGATPGDDPEPHAFFEGEVQRVEGEEIGSYGYGIATRSHQFRYLKFTNAVTDGRRKVRIDANTSVSRRQNLRHTRRPEPRR